MWINGLNENRSANLNVICEIATAVQMCTLSFGGSGKKFANRLQKCTCNPMWLNVKHGLQHETETKQKTSHGTKKRICDNDAKYRRNLIFIYVQESITGMICPFVHQLNCNLCTFVQAVWISAGRPVPCATVRGAVTILFIWIFIYIAG